MQLCGLPETAKLADGENAIGVKISINVGDPSVGLATNEPDQAAPFHHAVTRIRPAIEKESSASRSTLVPPSNPPSAIT